MQVTAEYWVMRVFTDEDGPVTLDRCTPAAAIAINAAVFTNRLAILPGGLVAEPVEVFDTEPEAHARCIRERAMRPREDFRVVMNADVNIDVNTHGSGAV